MTPKEALYIITTLNEALDMNDYMQAVDVLKDTLTQQEQLAKDVARYFYLENLPDDKYTVEVAIEHHALKEKLSKVGKEE